MEIIVAKIIVILLLTILRLVFGLLPLCLSKKLKKWTNADNPHRKQVDAIVSICLSLGGGILLATCFIHMVPEVRHGIEAYSKENHNFPFTELLVCIGFFIVYMVEESVRSCLLTRAEKQSDRHNHVDVPWTTKSRSEVTPLDQNSKLENNHHSHHLTGATCEHSSSEHIHSLRSFLVVLALSFHSVMEGLAIGLEMYSRDVWTLFVAVCIHECTILFCVGLEMLITKHTTISIFTHMVILAIVSPCGVLAGTIITFDPALDSQMQGLVIAVLQGLAAGTILYVTFFEVLDKERRREALTGLVKCLVIFIGFSLMVALELLGGHSHTHPHLEVACNNTCNSTVLLPP